jgi:phosphoglycolate phosphatase-like HAD superfamily hydrolase
LKYINIIFDFDGVLAESLHIKTQAFFQIYKQYGKDVAQQVVAHHNANGGMSRYEKFPYYHKKFLNIDLSEKEVNQLSGKFSKMVIDEVIKANEVQGASWFLTKYQNHCKYWIVSATPTNEIIEIATKRNVSNFFIKIYGSPDKKTGIVQNIINSNNLILNKTVFIGDAMSDFKAAEDNGIHFILRRMQENKDLFKEHSDIICFTDYYELDLLLGNQI